MAHTDSLVYAPECAILPLEKQLGGTAMTDKPKRKVGRPKKEKPYTSANIHIDVSALRRYQAIARKHDLSFSEFARQACDAAIRRLRGEDQKCA